MTEDQKARFKELFSRFGSRTNPMDSREWSEFVELMMLVPINLQTGKIPLLEEVSDEQRRV